MGMTSTPLSLVCCEPLWVLPHWCKLERLHSNQMPLRKQRAAIKPWQPHCVFCRDEPASVHGVCGPADPTCRKSPARSLGYIQKLCFDMSYNAANVQDILRAFALA